MKLQSSISWLDRSPIFTALRISQTSMPCWLADLMMQFWTYFWRFRQCQLNFMPFASSLHAAVAFSRATLSALDSFAAPTGVGMNAMPLTSTVAIMPAIKVATKRHMIPSFERYAPLRCLCIISCPRRSGPRGLNDARIRNPMLLRSLYHRNQSGASAFLRASRGRHRHRSLPQSLSFPKIPSGSAIRVARENHRMIGADARSPPLVRNVHRRLVQAAAPACSREPVPSPSTQHRFEACDLIRRMSKENPNLGTSRIHGELLMLGFEVAQSTVSKYMVQGRSPSQGWKTFFRNHAQAIAAIDLCVVPTLTFERLFAFMVLGHGRRRLLWFEVTRHPTAEWLARQITEAFPWASAPTYLVRDNDRAYGNVFRSRVRAMGIRDRPISPGSPWQNPYVERLIGTVRRECLDRVLIFGEAHLREILSSYAAYYNQVRTHLALGKDAPLGRAVQRTGAIVAIPILSGLHHHYVRI